MTTCILLILTFLCNGLVYTGASARSYERKSLRVGLTDSVSKRFKKTTLIENRTVEIEYVISGLYVYDANTGKILSAYNASLKNIMYADAGVGWHFSPKNISTNANKSSDGYTARFSASFHLYGNFSGENVKIEDADFGTLGDTVEVTPGSD